MKGYRGYNICPWLKNGKREICGKSCRYNYCKVHRARLRNGSQLSFPCLRCDIGVRSEIQLCRGCGREKERQRRMKKERQRLMKKFPSTAWPPEAPRTSPFEHSARAEKCFGAREKPDSYMQENEFCFGLRDLVKLVKPRMAREGINRKRFWKCQACKLSGCLYTFLHQQNPFEALQL